MINESGDFINQNFVEPKEASDDEDLLITASDILLLEKSEMSENAFDGNQDVKIVKNVNTTVTRAQHNTMPRSSIDRIIMKTIHFGVKLFDFVTDANTQYLCLEIGKIVIDVFVTLIIAAVSIALTIWLYVEDLRFKHKNNK